jgi:hypothetical protein
MQAPDPGIGLSDSEWEPSQGAKRKHKNCNAHQGLALRGNNQVGGRIRALRYKTRLAGSAAASSKQWQVY